MSNETEGVDNYVAFSIEGIALLQVGILGIVGNVAAITVFARQHLQKNFHALMMSLAAFDLLYILASILLFSIPQFSSNYKQSAFYNYILPWVLPLAQVSITGSIYFTMAITVERYVCVCWPFYRVSHTWPAKMMVIPLVAFSFLYNTPKFFELHTIVKGQVMYYENGTSYNAPEYGFEADPMRHNPYYYNIYCMWLNFFCMGLIPFILLIVLNALTLKELNAIVSGQMTHQIDSNLKKNLILAQVSMAIVFSFIVCHSIKWIPNIYEMLQELQHLGGGQVTHGPDSATNRRRDLVMAQVSLAIVFVFIVCHSIKWIPNIYELLQVGRAADVPLDWPEWIELVTHISHLMTVFNSSVNFYIYFAKHWRIILGRPEPNAQNHTEVMRLRTSVVLHNNHHYPSIAVNSFPQITTNNTQLSANQPENANEETHMLVNALVSAPNDHNTVGATGAKNGDAGIEPVHNGSELITRNGEVHC